MQNISHTQQDNTLSTPEQWNIIKEMLSILPEMPVGGKRDQERGRLLPFMQSDLKIITDE